MSAVGELYLVTALEEACQGDHIELVKFLLDNRVDVNAVGGLYSGTTLQATCQAIRIDMRWKRVIKLQS